MKRRHFLASGTLPLIGCEKSNDATGGFTGIQHERGHLLRGDKPWPAPSVIHTTRIVIAGGGVAGLAAARALRQRGMDDFALLELEDEAGGNSRGGAVNGIACPLGAHYLPVPGDDANEVQNLLEEFGVRQRIAGRWAYDERHLCHSPQERLFFNGAWQPGLLPVQGVGRDTLAQYQKFAALVEQVRKAAKWTIPLSKKPIAPVHITLLAITFVAYLNQNGLTDPRLRWYLDYCCRDDYGAGIATVSAWAGMHYFASRHGFTAPASNKGDGLETNPMDGGAAASNVSEHDDILTWPEGNAWLTRRLAAPLKERLHSGWVVVRIAAVKHGVEVDAFNPATQTMHRWVAARCIVALPIFVAARVVENPPDFLRQAAASTRYAPWLVANIHIKAPLQDRPGPAASWDNVIYGGFGESSMSTGGGLGYVDATHQSLLPVPGATVLTHYRALGDVPQGRKLLMDTPWATWRDTILAELSQAHPDIRSKATRIDITRYGHAMAVPVPRISGQTGLWPASSLHNQLLKQKQTASSASPLAFAHSDWAGYSVFEEAFTLGHVAGGVV
jgi:monoamine oxidase